MTLARQTGSSCACAAGPLPVSSLVWILKSTTNTTHSCEGRTDNELYELARVRFNFFVVVNDVLHLADLFDQQHILKRCEDLSKHDEDIDVFRQRRRAFIDAGVTLSSPLAAVPFDEPVPMAPGTPMKLVYFRLTTT